MVSLEPITDDLKCGLFARGDKVVLIQGLLIDKGYKFEEMVEYLREFNWAEWEE